MFFVKKISTLMTKMLCSQLLCASVPPDFLYPVMYFPLLEFYLGMT